MAYPQTPVHGQSTLGNNKQAWNRLVQPDISGTRSRLGRTDDVQPGAIAWQRSTGRWAKQGAGQVVYDRIGCGSCTPAGGLGPDLHGAAARFSRDDLFTSIVQPVGHFTPFRTTMIETENGRSTQGLIIYEAVDGLILQTGPTTVRLAGNQITSPRDRRVADATGLLDKSSDCDIADLYGYLKSLGNPAK